MEFRKKNFGSIKCEKTRWHALSRSSSEKGTHSLLPFLVHPHLWVPQCRPIQQRWQQLACRRQTLWAELIFSIFSACCSWPKLTLLLGPNPHGFPSVGGSLNRALSSSSRVSIESNPSGFWVSSIPQCPYPSSQKIPPPPSEPRQTSAY